MSAHHAKQKQEMGLQNVDVAYNPNYIVSLKVDHDGIVWAGTWGGGLARYDGKQWKNYTVANGLPGSRVDWYRAGTMATTLPDGIGCGSPAGKTTGTTKSSTAMVRFARPQR